MSNNEKCHLCDERDAKYWSCGGYFNNPSAGLCDHSHCQAVCEQCGAEQGWWSLEEED